MQDRDDKHQNAKLIGHQSSSFPIKFPRHRGTNPQRKVRVATGEEEFYNGETARVLNQIKESLPKQATTPNPTRPNSSGQCRLYITAMR
jgi:hypothetical protein